jgi:hypothetical protein
MFHVKDRAYAASLHFGLSAAIAALAALVVFVVWYPYPYRELSGGRELFLLVVSVDVILGPLMTFAIFSRSKSRRALCLDFALIGLVQLAGLSYGMWTVFVARPVHLVFEYDRFRVVHAIDVPPEWLDRAPPDLRTLPLHGPTLLALRPLSAQEKFSATMAALGGATLAARPDLWRDYAAARADVRALAKPLPSLRARFPDRTADLDAAVRAAGRPEADLAWAPMVGRKSFWTVLLDRNSAEVLGFLPLDSF